MNLSRSLSLAAGQTVVSERTGSVVTVAINRPEVRNAVNQETARRLLEELKAFDSDPGLNVAILHGKGKIVLWGRLGLKLRQIFAEALQSLVKRFC